MSRKVSIAIGVAVFVLDLLVKFWVQRSTWLHYYPLIDGLLTIRYATNRGIAFGFFHEMQSQWKAPILSILAVLALGLVLYYIWTTPLHERLVLVALGLLLGGISGNFVDRLLDDSVVDFIKIHWGEQFAWPTFNLADSAITAGVIGVLLATLFGSQPQEEPTTEDPIKAPEESITE